VFVAGTDTGVGKTEVACALLHGFAERGWRVAGMKPVAAGAQRRRGALRNEDVARLCAVTNIDVRQNWINPYCFAPPIAPHVAACEAGIAIRMSVIARAYARLACRADLVVVEGVGGLLVPLSARLSAADIPAALGLPVVLVVGVRLGCLNHALLTVEVLRARGLRLAGWIANRIDPRMLRAAQSIQALRRSMGAPLLGEVSHTRLPQPGRFSRALDFERLQAAF